MMQRRRREEIERWKKSETDDSPAAYPPHQTLKPCGSWVLLKDIDNPTMYHDILHLPRRQDNKEMTTMEATVEAVGRTVTKVKPGDRVVVMWSMHLTYDSYEARVLSFFPQKMRLIKEHKILGVLEHG